MENLEFVKHLVTGSEKEDLNTTFTDVIEELGIDIAAHGEFTRYNCYFNFVSEKTVHELHFDGLRLEITVIGKRPGVVPYKGSPSGATVKLSELLDRKVIVVRWPQTKLTEDSEGTFGYDYDGEFVQFKAVA